MKYVFGLGLLGAVGWLFSSTVIPIYMTCVQVLGSAMTKGLVFFQYYLWATPAGNTIVAAGVLLGLSLPVYLVFAGQTRRLLMKSRFDETLKKKVVAHVIDQTQRGLAVPYTDAIPSAAKILILRICCWTAIAAAFLGLGLLSLWLVPSVQTWAFLALGAVLAVFFFVRFLFAKPRSEGPSAANSIGTPNTHRGTTCPHCGAKTSRGTLICKSCGKYL